MTKSYPRLNDPEKEFFLLKNNLHPKPRRELGESWKMVSFGRTSQQVGQNSLATGGSEKASTNKHCEDMRCESPSRFQLAH